MISILIASMREPQTIGRAVESFVGDYKGEFELLVSIPDDETYQALLAKVQQLGWEKRLRRSEVSKQGKPLGKPRELNELMDMAKGDIWFFGDGDTYFGDSVIDKMLKHFADPEVAAVTGRPKSSDSLDAMMSYYGHLLADAAHHKRMVDLTDTPTGRSLRFVKKRAFFPVSGYLFAMRASDIRAPIDTLVEDAYFSYEIYNRGGRIEYEPEAEVFVKYPANLKDYFKQKKRSAGGYVQLWSYGVVSKDTKTRSFWRELEYFWFPINYAKSLKQLWWSLLLYPIRLWLWIRIYYEQKIIKKDFFRTWERVESTK